MESPKTLLDAVKFFADVENCRQFMVAIHWEDGIVRCPQCGAEVKTYLPKAKQYFCKVKHPKQKFSLKVGTIFEDSPIGLDKWLPAYWLLTNCKNGISSYELARAIGVTQKSAWFMLHRIRYSLTEVDGGKLGGAGYPPIEIDETFVGGKVKNMHKSRREVGMSYSGGKGKAIVMGMLERGGKIRASVIPNRKLESMRPPVQTHVAELSHIITDEHSCYPFIAGDAYFHEVINHVEGYVREHVHTNGIENFWALLKRSLGGTYISVEPFHLDAYVTEQVWRFNNRLKMTDANRFQKAVGQGIGKRLTLAELTGKVNERPC